VFWKRKQCDYNAEIDAHLQLEADRLREDGLTPEEARSAALRTFGNRTLAEERFYESRHWMFLNNLFRDVRFAVRVLAKDARFSILAILGLGLGIGLSTAIFTLVNMAIHMRSEMGETDPAYISLTRTEKGHPRSDTSLSYPDYLYFQSRATAFRALKAESGRFRFILGASVVAGQRTEAEEAQGRFESANFLSAIGFQPALGRGFSAEEEQIGGPAVAMLSFRFWRSHFAEDPRILGKTVVLNAHPFTIVGVADARFGSGDRSDFFLPLVLETGLFLSQGDWLHDPNQHWLMVDGWLRQGVPVSQAQAETDVLSHALQKSNESFVVSHGGNRGKAAELALIFTAMIVAVSMILLIACSNLANLLLARAVVRRREIGVRLSLGASRARLVCQLLTESMLMAIAGGALGLLFSYWLARALLLLDAGAGVDPRIDVRVLLYVLALVTATGFSIGLAPALTATKTNLAEALHSEGLSGVRSPSKKFWSPRNALVIVPLTVSLMLLVGAGMTIRMIRDIYLNAPTFDASRLISMSFRLNWQGYDEMRTRQFQENLRERATKIPGVTSVALATTMPLSNGFGWFPLITEGSAVLPDDGSPHADYNVVSPEFFETVGVPVVRGRAFNASDREGGPTVVMVNQELGRSYWANENPIGKRLRFGTTFFEVVGVAPDFEDSNSVFNSVRPTVYVPYAQAKPFFNGVKIDAPVYETQILVHANGNQANVKASLRREAMAVDSSLRVEIQTVEEMMESRVGPVKTTMWLLSALGALALLMASVGIYAALAYGISQRTREIGIRMALGAQRREILALVMQRTMALVVWSIGFGMLGAFALNRIFSRSLRKLGELDALTCISVAILLGIVALLASYFPSRKALRVDPVQALRCE